jgi:competence protein ComEA
MDLQEIPSHIKKVVPYAIVVVLSIAITKQYFTKVEIEPPHTTEVSETTPSAAPTVDAQIYVDVAGGVINPGLFALDPGSRIAEAIAMAGGVSKHASVRFLNQEINMSSKLKDGQKIYIPFIFDEDKTGYVTRNLDLLCTNTIDTTNDDKTEADSSKVDVNKASKSELMDLPGIGEVTADKIISGRPYTDINDFYTRIKLNATTKAKLEPVLAVQ